MENMLTIGQLAKRTDTTAVAIRYYEKQGLIPKSKRTQGGFRLYPESVISRFHFIKNAKGVGFSLEEIKELLSLQQKKGMPSKAIKDLTLSKIDEIQDKVKILKQMQKVLVTWAEACDGKAPIEQCPILEHLYQSSKKTPS